MSHKRKLLLNAFHRGRKCHGLTCCASLVLLIVLVTFVPLSGLSQTLPNGNTDQFTVSVNVEVVVLHPSVRDRKGTPVLGLSKENFQVFEDNVLQQIDVFSREDVPVTVGLLIDNSGSMGPKRAEVIAAALKFARSSNPNDEIFVINFNENVWLGLPDDVPFTGDITKLELALSGIKSDGKTALYDAVAAALKHMAKSNRDKRILIVVSDGGDNASHSSLDDTLVLAKRSDALIYAIGLFDPEDLEKNPNALKELAKVTGGEAFLPESLRELIPICEQIARDVRSQYTLAYKPTNIKQDGSYRATRVKARSPGGGNLVVRARAGYYAPLSSGKRELKDRDHGNSN